ncbi:T9SS type A sorting domain-containing protein [Algoriphagus aestuarii]|nr:T9SS type A sorting domain-containing protein [Algoriphagus aestuarii]
MSHWNMLHSQEVGAYKTVQNGDFSNPSTWNIFNGFTWQAATSKPNSANDIYVDKNHLLTLNANEEAKSVFINSQDAVPKLNLNNFNLNIFGTIQGFSGNAPGLPDGAHNSLNWIGNSFASSITFKGNSRTIILDGAWSGNSQNSNFTVIFDPGPGVELSVEEPFKALRFILRSGTLIQNLTNTNSCSSFSFNVNNSYGLGSFGIFTIENGATLLSKCNDGIIFRSGTRSASTFDLQDGGELILEGQSPEIEAASFQFDGKVIFRNNSNPQSFLGSTYSGSGIPDTFHDLEIQGSQNLTMPPYLSVTGDLIQSGSGKFLMNSSEIEFAGSENQQVEGFSMTVGNLTLNKASSSVSFEQDLTVMNNLEMVSGQMNLQENNLAINSSLTGGLIYSGGSWSHVGQFTYFGVPSTFDATNGSFPFADRYQGGVRKIQMLGSSAGGNLQISFTEYKGAEYNSSFLDNDGTPILYRLFSYFQFSGLNPSSNPLELRISADKLIVAHEDDLRIVATGYAAPGTHLPGLDPSELWARRSLTFDDLKGVNFTVGSFRTLSILPIKFKTVQVKWENNLPKISWESEGENDFSVLDIMRFEGTDTTKTLLKSIHYLRTNSGVFIDSLPVPHGETYYQLRISDPFGVHYSSAIRLPKSNEIESKLFPNPSRLNEKVYLKLPAVMLSSLIQVITMDGKIIRESSYQGIEISSLTDALEPGNYILRILGQNEVFIFKLIRNY